MIYSIHPQVDSYLWFNIDGDAARKALGEDTMFHFDESPISYRVKKAYPYPMLVSAMGGCY
jgi:hypothetical protein